MATQTLPPQPVVRPRNHTAPPTATSVDPALLQLLDYLTSLYHAVWRITAVEGVPLSAALHRYNLTLPMWNSRRLIAETWISFRDPYLVRLDQLTSGMVGRRGKMVEILYTAATHTLRHWTRRRTLQEKRRSGVIMM